MGDDILQQIKKDYETAEEWLLNYPSRLTQYYKDLNYIHTECRTSEVFVQTGLSDVVSQKVVSLAELEKTEKWLIAVELIKDMLGPKKRLFLELRQKAAKRNQTVNGREVWRSYVQKHYASEMAKMYNGMPERFWLHDNTITNWWNEIVELFRLVAIKKGCF